MRIQCLFIIHNSYDFIWKERIRKDIRKAIRKQAGDTVNVTIQERP
ncbi:DUF1905 domain-containing protein [[Clostridium] scindens]|nr:DUF1905 domain-containing protein [Lachnospiraceae bacterium]NSJ15550.1 DUF1905 domain-containing protein [[Clostridium] scindens]